MGLGVLYYIPHTRAEKALQNLVKARNPETQLSRPLALSAHWITLPA